MRMLVLLLFIGLATAQPYLSCLDLCALGGLNATPGDTVTCASNRITLNYPSIQWGCNKATPRDMNSDVICSDSTVINRWPGQQPPGPQCTWSLTNIGTDDSAQFVITWNASNLADLGDEPVFTFAASVSNPSPASLTISVTSTDGVRSVACTPFNQFDLRTFTNNGNNPQPQIYTVPFKVADCPVGFNPHRVLRMFMGVSGPALPVTQPISFTLIQSTAPNIGPCFSTNVCPQPSFTIAKTANVATVNAAGNVINYSIVINNNGQQNLTGMVVNDPKISGLTCAPVQVGGQLNVGLTTTCVGSHTMTQAEINAGGSYDNTVTARFTEFGPLTAGASVSIVRTPDFSVTKTVTPTSTSTINTELRYLITVTNLGNVDLANFVLQDTLLNNSVTCTGASPNSGGSLNTGASTQCSGSYIVTQNDFNTRATIDNTVTIMFSNPGLNSKSAFASVALNRVVSFDFTKTNNLPVATQAGQIINYTMVVTNTGNADLTGLSILDSLLPSVVCSPVALGGSLSVSSPSTTCRGSRTVTQDDLNRGGNITNIATASFSGPTGISPKTATTTTQITGSPGVNIIKNAIPSEVNAPGQTITYTVQVINTGNVDLPNFQLIDSKLTSGFTSCQGAQIGSSLPVGITAVCTGTYQTTQADILAGGQIVNVATVTTARTTPRNATATVNVRQTAMFTISKTTATTSVNAAGQEIRYTIIVRNTGTLTLTNFRITDPLIQGGTGTQVSCSPALLGQLLAGQQANCSGSYIVKQSDINSGADIVNTATAQFNEIGPMSADVSTSVLQSPALTISKTASLQTVTVANTPIQYSITITNAGNVVLTGYNLLDPLIQLKDNNLVCNPAVSQPIAVGQSAVCTGSYTVSQEDLNTKTEIVNIASVTTNELPQPRTAQTNTVLLANAVMSVTKSTTTTSVDAAGARITYNIRIANGGNVDLPNLIITDPLIQSGQNDLQCTPTSAGQTLRVGQTTTCTGSYVVTATDMSNGTPIINVVTADADRVQPLTANATTVILQNPVFTSAKTADVSQVKAAGNQINWRIQIQNTGNVDLLSLAISDNLLPSGLTCSPFGLGQNLPFGQSTTCRGVTTVTQADINLGRDIVNVANITFSNRNLAPQTVTATVTVAQSPSFTVTKSVDKLTTQSANDVLSYTILISNTGNLDLARLTVTDALIAGQTNDLNCSPVGQGGTLPAFTGTTTCRGTYRTTQGDINSGNNIVNTVLVALGGVPTQTATATTSVLQNRALSITKRASVTSVNSAGTPISYTIVVSNVGNVDLTALQITDDRISSLACTPVTVGGTLPVAGSTTCTGIYSVTQSDINAGTPLLNRATASAAQTAQVAAIATVNIQQNAMMIAAKTVNLATVNAAGIVLRYTITVNNTGNEDLTNFQINDPLIQNNARDLTCNPVALGQTLTVVARATVCTGTYVVLQRDINAGVAIVNNATVTTTQVAPIQVFATTTVVRSPAISITKQASRAVANAAGQVIEYLISISNTGNTDLSNMQVDDALVDTNNNNLVCSPVAKSQVLGVKVTTTCRGSYTVSQRDINAGTSITNVAGVTTSETTRQTAQAVTTITQTPQFTITKKASVTSVNAANQQIQYTIDITNTGNIDLSSLQVSDPRLGSTLQCSPVPIGSTLTVAAPLTTCTGTYTVTQADINSGNNIPNTVTARVQQINQDKSASANVVVVATPGLSLTKTADRASVNAAGQQVTYSIVAKNTGNQDLSNFQLSDSLINSGQIRCSPVAVGQTLTVATGTTTCTGVYTVTQSDMNFGQTLVNTAIAQATQVGPQTARAEVNVVQQPSHTVAKTVDQSVATFAGQVLRYQIAVRNTGNIDLTNMNIQDSRIQSGANDLSCSPVQIGQTLTVQNPLTTCTGSYRVTQSDLNSGQNIVNTVTSSFRQGASQTAEVTTSVSQTPAMSITKAASVPEVSQLGQIITYTIRVGNIGNIALLNLQVTDNRVTGLSCSPVAVGSVLQVNQTTTCTGSYAVTQADLNSGGPLLNTASASSTQTQPITAIANVNVLQNARFNVTKTASLSSVSVVGTVIDYTIQISNTGNEDLLNLQVDDPLIANAPGRNDLRCSPVAIGQTLTVAIERTTCTGSYLLTQDRIDSGETITNVVNVVFSQTGIQTASVNTAVVRAPSFTLTKTADMGTVNAAGQTIRYSIVVRNTGNTRLTNLDLQDALIETGNKDITCSGSGIGGTLLVSQSTTCTGTYTVTQANINAGTPIENVVTVQFSEAPLQTARVQTAISQNRVFTITKTASVPSVNAANQTIGFTINIVNTGNVDLLNFALSDPLIDLNDNNVQCTPVQLGGTLTVATRTTVCTGTYTAKQSDINAGVPIVNRATATFSNAPSASAQVSVNVVVRPLLTIDKTADRSTVNQTGQVIGYAIVVKNTGNNDLTNLQVKDNRIQAFDNNLRCSPFAVAQTLPVGASTTCTGTYTVKQSDINAGTPILNTASAQAGAAPEVSDSVTVNVNRIPSFTIGKSANVERVNAAGNVVTWTVVVRNNGNQDLSSFSLVDPLVDTTTGDMRCTPIAKGATLTVANPVTTCVGTYVLTQSDLNALSSIVNNATASFDQASAQTATASVTIDANPALSITKVANPTLVNSVGDVVRYTIVVTNVGNVDLPSLAVTDARVSGLSCAPTAVGQTLRVNNPITTCTGTYITTQTDLNSGNAIVNTASASSARTIPVSAQATVDVEQQALFEIVKVSDRTEASAAGQIIRYSISIKNTGTVDLTNMQVQDTRVASLTCSPVAIGGTLTVAAPTTVCTASYTVTQSDMDAGEPLVNIASATFVQHGPKSAQTTTLITQLPSMTINKSANVGVVQTAQTEIAYTIIVRNTGNVGLRNLQVADSLIDGSSRVLTCQPIPEGATLPVASSTTCTGGYLVTQANLNSGENIVNTATATAQNFGPVSDSAVVRVLQIPTLEVTKAGDLTQVDAAGQVISYTIQIKNTGNVDLVNLQVADALIDNSSNNLICFPVAEGATLTVAQPQTTCTGTYRTVQEDINRGTNIVNRVIVTTVQSQPVGASFATAVIQRPSVTVTKSADRPSISDANDIILYTMVVRNTGNVDLTGFQVLDPLIDNNMNDVSCKPIARGAGILLVNTTTTCSGSYRIPQSVINVGGFVRNEVVVTSNQASASATVQTIIIQNPALTANKTADRLTVSVAGEVIGFEIEIINVGNLDLNNLQVADSLVESGTNNLLCSPVANGQTLPVDGRTTCTGSYIVKQADLNAGGVIQNNALITTTQTATFNTQSNTIVAQIARLLVSKTANPMTVNLPGQTINYEIRVKNAGNVDLRNLQVSDNQLSGAVTCTPVAQGGTLTVAAPDTLCVGSRVVTQEMIDNAIPIINVATATTLQTGPVQAMAMVNVAQNALLTVKKTASVATVDRAGQEIVYSIVATNEGTVELENFQLSDPLLGNNIVCTPVSFGQTLLVGRSTTCTGTYTVLQSDINFGANIVNTVTVQTSQAGPVSAMTVTSITQRPTFTVTKTANPTSVNNTGRVITFSIAIVNTGNMDLENFRVSDALIDQHDNNLACAPIAEGSTLTVANPTTTCTGTYTVTQKDMNAGLDIVNFVSVNTNQIGPITARATVSINQVRGLSVVKRVSVPSVSILNQIITFSITIFNTGNVDLFNLQVVDPMIDNGRDDLVCTPTREASTLTVSSPSTTCIGSYKVTQADLNRGTPLTNVASVSATGIGPINAEVTVTITQNGAFTVSKIADRSSVVKAGEIIKYNVLVYNTGNIDLTNFQLSDPLVNGQSIYCFPVKIGQDLTVATHMTNCTMDYRVTQQDMDTLNSITNAATVRFSNVVTAVSANVTSTIIKQPSLTIVKDADRFSVNSAGQVISYNILVQNTGNLNLPNFQLTDPLIPSLNCRGISNGGVLNVDSSVLCVGNYTVTQSNIDAGVNIVNTATVRTSLTNSTTASFTVFLTQTAQLFIRKTANVDTVSQAGNVIQYTILISNTGNVDQTGLVIQDNKVPSLSCTPSGSTLAAGASMTCIGSYTVTAADIDAGTPIVNLASARSTQATMVVAQSTVNVFSFPQFTAQKIANTSSVSSVGQSILYTVIVRNTGTVALTNLQIRDPLVPSMSCTPIAVGQTLPRGGSTTCTGVYVVTQGDINQGSSISNSAFVSFNNGGTVIGTVVVGVNSNAGFTVSKIGVPAVVNSAGNVIQYTVRVTNVGNTDLTAFQINDPLLPGGFSCTPIAPGQTLPRNSQTICTAPYTVTSGDITRGQIVNVVSVVLGGIQRTASFVVTVQQTPSNSLTITKTSSPNFVSNVGDRINYTITATNVGTVPLLNVVITDALLPSLTCLPLPNGSPLQPQTSLVCTGFILVTQAQLNAGSIRNTAQVIASGITIPSTTTNVVVVAQSPPATTTQQPPPTATATTRTTAASVTITGQTTAPPQTSTTNSGGFTTSPTGTIMFLTKTSSPTIVSTVGQIISYTIVTTNANLFQVTNVRINDPFLLSLTCSPPLFSTLQPGQSMTCIGSHTVTAAEVASGVNIVNTATVSVTGLNDITQAKATVVIAAQGRITVSKTTTATQYAVAGERIPYIITVLNNANVNAINLQVVDPLIASSLVCTPVSIGGTLLVGQTTICTGYYTVTDFDIQNGQPIVNNVAVSSVSIPGGGSTSTVSTPKGNQGQLNFQIVIIDGQLQIIFTRDTENNENQEKMDTLLSKHNKRAEFDLSTVQLQIVDSTGAVTFTNLTSDGKFSGIFAPGPALINVLTSTLPNGLSLAPSFVNPFIVTIPANGVINAQLVFTVSTVLGGHIYNDVNGNGIQDFGEPNIANVNVSVVSNGLLSFVLTNNTGDWRQAVAAGNAISVINVATLNLGDNPVQTQGTNPTFSNVPTGTALIQTPSGFRSGATPPPPTTAPPTTAPPTTPPITPTQPGDTEINFHFAGILNGAGTCGGCCGSSSCNNNKKK